MLELTNGSADIKSASACDDAIVYDQGGSIHLFDVKSHTAKAVPISVAADLPAVRPKMEPVAKTISAADLSPSVRAEAVFQKATAAKS